MKDDYRQLSFFDFVLKKPETTLIENKDELPVSTTTTERHTDNLCPYAVPTIKEIVKLIDDAAVFHDKDRFLSDLFCCMAVSISNIVGLYHKDEREEQYKQIISQYSKTEQQAMSEISGKLFMLLSSVVYDDGVFSDYLGEIFMTCNMGSGSGGMVLAAMDVLKNDFGINYTMDCFADCSDIDLRCVHMTYLQLSLVGVPAIVKHQDALTRKLYSLWKTPAFVFQYPRFRKYLN